MNEVLTTKVWS